MDQLDLFNDKRPSAPEKLKSPKDPKEWKIVALRDCPLPMNLAICDSPEHAADYWRLHVPKHPCYSEEIECLVVLILNTRKRVRGHYFVAHGTLDMILVHPREVFRLALIAGAASVIVLHNHPSGDPTPSDADIRVTRDLIRAGQLLKVDLLDHIIVGKPNFSSLKELGYFH